MAACLSAVGMQGCALSKITKTTTRSFDEYVSTAKIPRESEPAVEVEAHFEGDTLVAKATKYTECWTVETVRSATGTYLEHTTEGISTDLIAGLVFLGTGIALLVDPNVFVGDTDSDGEPREKETGTTVGILSTGLGTWFVGAAVITSVMAQDKRTDVTYHEVTNEHGRRRCSVTGVVGATVVLRTAAGRLELGHLDGEGRGAFPLPEPAAEIHDDIASLVDTDAILVIETATQKIDVAPWRSAYQRLAYERARADGNASVYEKFVERFPDSVHTDAVLVRLAALYWPDVAASRNLAEVIRFLTRFDKAAEHEDARSLAAELELAAIRDQGTPEDLMELVRRYPATAAAASSATLAEHRAWNRLRGTNNSEPYESYLELFPDGERSEKVRIRLTEIEANRARPVEPRSLPRNKALQEISDASETAFRSMVVPDDGYDPGEETDRLSYQWAKDAIVFPAAICVLDARCFVVVEGSSGATFVMMMPPHSKLRSARAQVASLVASFKQLHSQCGALIEVVNDKRPGGQRIILSRGSAASGCSLSQVFVGWELLEAGTESNMSSTDRYAVWIEVRSRPVVPPTLDVPPVPPIKFDDPQPQ